MCFRPILIIVYLVLHILYYVYKLFYYFGFVFIKLKENMLEVIGVYITNIMYTIL